MKHRIAFLIMFATFPVLLGAQEIYLEFDTSCMQRLEYKGAGTGTPYYAFSASLPNGGLIVMDIGTTAPSVLQNIPSGLYKCGTFNPTIANIQQINKGELKLAVFVNDRSQMQAHVVQKVTLLQPTKDGINVHAHDAEFAFNPDKLESGKNLALEKSQMSVYLEGLVKTQCAKGYIFRKMENTDASTYKEWIIIPQIGIVEKSSVQSRGTSTDMTKSSLRLSKIGEDSFLDFLTKWCDKLQVSYYEGKKTSTNTDYSNLVEQPTYKKHDAQLTKTPCAPSSVPGIHIVQKGETLYSLSRRYGISLQDLRKWNGLGNSNVINVCQQLVVADPSVTTIPPSEKKSEENASNSVASTSKEPSTTSWHNAPEYHTVRPGETVAMLANMYGYTEERFRKMNGLGVAEEIVPGQKLRTTDCICPETNATASLANASVKVDAQTTPATELNNNDVFFKPIRVHVVRKTDTLFSIAKQYNTTPERIKELNDLKSGDKLFPGQKLYVQ